MNDRILELAVKAELYIDWNGRPYPRAYPRAMSAEESRAAYAKFAELIIQESITRITRMGILNNCEEQSKMACDELKEHFGIK